MVPQPSEEALWIGLGPEEPSRSLLVCVIAGLEDGEDIDAVSGAPVRPPGLAGVRAGLVVPPRTALDGIARMDGTSWPFVRTRVRAGEPACRAIRLLVLPARERGAPQQPPAAPPMPLHDVPGAGGARGEAAPRTAPVDDTLWNVEESASVRIRFTDPDEFVAATGTSLRPLDMQGTYRGWRLP